MARHHLPVIGRHQVWLALAAAIPLTVLAVFFVYPVAGMVRLGFVPEGRPDIVGVLEVLARPRTLRVLWFTVWTALIGTAVTVVAGVPLAALLYRRAFVGRGLLRAVVVVPFVLPTIVVGIAFSALFADSGWLGALGWAGTPAAIIAALVFFNLAVVVRTVGAFWEGLDPRREEAAAALGASPTQVFWTVTLPALRPALVGAGTVVFLFCSTAFGVVLTLGGLRYANVETEIYLLTTQELDLAAAAALSILQVLVIGLLLTVTHLARRDPGPVDRKHASARPLDVRRRGDLVLTCWAGMVVVALVLPMLTLLVRSLQESGGGRGLGNYRRLAAGSEDLPSSPLTGLSNSLQIGAVATILALFLGTIVAIVVSREVRGAGRRRALAVFDAAFMLPLGVSAVTLGFGFLVTLDSPPLDLRSSPWLVPVAQAMVALPLVVRTIAPVLRGIDPRQRQVAASLGAGPARVLVSVDLPVAWRAVLAAAGFAFAVSLGEFGATSFVVRDQTPTLPVLIYQLSARPGAGNAGTAMAASVVLATVTGAVMFAVERLRGGATTGAF